jgi:integrase
VPVKKKGTAEFRSGRWWARPTLADGSRGDRVHLPPGTSEAKAREVAAHLTERAAEQGLTKETVEAKRVAMQPPPPHPKGKTVSEWGVAWLEERERRGLASVRTDRGRWEKWVEPQIGALEMATVTTEDLERLVQHIDDAVRDGKFHWKTAKNTWGLVTKAFKDACRSKTLSLRVRKDNPAQDIEGPDQGAERGKQFLYPSEFNALMECAEVPARWRRLVAVQTYLYCRAGELEALHLADVDIEHRTIHIHRSVDRDHDGALKETKTNSPRRIPVEPNLLPLLKQLVAESAWSPCRRSATSRSVCASTSAGPASTGPNCTRRRRPASRSPGTTSGRPPPRGSPSAERPRRPSWPSAATRTWRPRWVTSGSPRCSTPSRRASSRHCSARLFCPKTCPKSSNAGAHSVGNCGILRLLLASPAGFEPGLMGSITRETLMFCDVSVPKMHRNRSR